MEIKRRAKNKYTGFLAVARPYSGPGTIRVTVTGASGFIGQQLITSAPESWQLNALSRGSAKSREGNISWRQADLFSLQSSTDALKDTDVAIYLVHSMLPSTRLFQGSFADADLLIADNFAYACKKNNVINKGVG